VQPYTPKTGVKVYDFGRSPNDTRGYGGLFFFYFYILLQNTEKKKGHTRIENSALCWMRIVII